MLNLRRGVESAAARVPWREQWRECGGRPRRRWAPALNSAPVEHASAATATATATATAIATGHSGGRRAPHAAEDQVRREKLRWFESQFEKIIDFFVVWEVYIFFCLVFYLFIYLEFLTRLLEMLLARGTFSFYGFIIIIVLQYLTLIQSSH